MAKNVEQFEQELFAESDGSKFSKIVEKLIKAHKTKALPVLMRYVKEGKLLHWRNFLMNDVIALIHEGDNSHAGFFQWSITQNELAYWSVDGLLKSTGTHAYPQLVAIALDENHPLELRSKAVKSLALHSRQPFDRDLPKDPGYWKKESLRTEELVSWQERGFPPGSGYATPPVHPSLREPITALEKAAAKLEKKLQLLRIEDQDPASPSNWLSIASQTEIEAIQKKWKLPAIYLQFLQQFSPLNVFIDDEKYFQGLDLYGAATLIERQNGYSFDAVQGKAIKDWPPHYLVIADAGADPYCIDINDELAPVYTSMHGGPWEFELYAASFLEFLEELGEK